VIDRRTFIRGVVTAFVVTPLAVAAQQRVPRIGFLIASPTPNDDVFWQELRRLGYVTDKNISVDYRSADRKFERLADLAAELVRHKVDVIVAVVTQASIAAKQATDTIPIVMVGVSDPVESGLVGSLARPGGNVTGTSTRAADVVGKQLELVHELFPHVTRVAVLWNSANQVFQRQTVNEARGAAAKLRLQLQFFEARDLDELDRAFAAISQERLEAIMVLPDPVFGSHAKVIGDLSIKYRLPVVGGTRLYAKTGVLATYGPDYSESYRRAAAYVDKILKGARPADLPVEQNTKFELVVNAGSARALGVTIPQSVLLRASDVIE
jgi:putative tryptophan/tyrosine transport system substrate-binding protein